MNVLEQIRVEWGATVFGLLVGITMVYVPYEFGASPFQFIYPHIRFLGTAFLAGSITLVATQLYPSWPAWIGWLGRVVLLAALAAYWWTVSILTGGTTGALLYPLMAAAVVLEGLPRWRHRGLFPAFVALVALAFGGLMLLDPIQFGPILYAALHRVLGPLGVLYLGAGALLIFGLARKRYRLSRWVLGLLGCLFVQLAAVLGSSASWAGMELYVLLAAECFLALLFRQLPRPSGVRWRLFRGMALASVLPILTVGALTSVLAQRAIERELRAKAQDAVSAEIVWLEQMAQIAHTLISAEAQDPSFIAAVQARDPVVLQARLNLLERQSEQFDAAWLLDESGNLLARSNTPGHIQGNFSERDYFQQVQQGQQTYLSHPFISAIGLPFVAFSAPVDLGNGHVGVLAGGMSLLHIRLQQTHASRSYHIELFDHRNGSLLHETHSDDVLHRAPVLSLVGQEALSAPEGMLESFEPSGRRLLIAHARVPSTPWTVAVTVRLREAFAPLTRLSALVVGIALLAGAFALVLSRWVGREVGQRLEALRDGFVALETLSLDRPVPAHGDDELAQLTSGFNAMAARIERTQKELREAIALRDQFLSMASHELRTPLTPLKATVELLLRQAPDSQGLSPERQRSTLERLRRQVDRLSRLVGDMLDVARLQAGRLSLKRAPVDLSALAREVVDRIQHSRQERAGPILLELPEQPLVGEWDEQRLDQLLTNLVENAVRYSPPEQPISVRARPEGDSVLLEVEDRGIGISAENLPNLFSPFYRAQNAALYYAGGLGLGLAICREIVERHGGSLWATSPGPGQGSRFSVRLPRTPSPGDP
jgi:signal transduction histidine kinase